jgi:hypothetical protein
VLDWDVSARGLMTIKLLLLKSGEDLIADLQEMVVGDDDHKRVVGYFLTKPCVVKLINDSTPEQKSLQISLYPWMPLSSDDKVPVPADWIVTIVEPIDKLKEMYVKDVINYGKQDNQDSSSTESTTTDQ